MFNSLKHDFLILRKIEKNRTRCGFSSHEYSCALLFLLSLTSLEKKMKRNTQEVKCKHLINFFSLNLERKKKNALYILFYLKYPVPYKLIEWQSCCFSVIFEVHLTLLGIEQRVKSFNVCRGRGLPKKIKRKDRGGRTNKGPNIFSGMDDFQEVLKISI